MKTDTRKIISWCAVNGGFLVAMIIALSYPQNVLTAFAVLFWFFVAITPLMLLVPKRAVEVALSPIPYWVEVFYDGLVVLILADCGHPNMALGWLFHMTVLCFVVVRSKNLQYAS